MSTARPGGITATAVGLLGRLVRATRPRGRHLVARLIHRAWPRRIEYRDRWGWLHDADLSDPSEALGFVGKPELAREIGDRIGKGAWVVDVGANVGIVTAALCRIVGPDGYVWAFEPLPENLLRLETLKQANDLAQLQLFPGALSSENGEAQLQLPVDGNRAHPSLAMQTGVEGSVRVRTWALDSLPPPRSGRRIEFIKLDIEGHEPAFLAGARETLAAMRPLVLCEFNDPHLREGGSSAEALLQEFARFGYRPVSAYREGRPLGPIPPGTSPWQRIPVDWMVVDLLLEAPGA
jgi:FkbM family methyltransferase